MLVIYVKIELLKLYDIHTLEISKLIYKLFNNKLPQRFRTTFTKLNRFTLMKLDDSNSTISFYHE